MDLHLWPQHQISQSSSYVHQAVENDKSQREKHDVAFYVFYQIKMTLLWQLLLQMFKRNTENYSYYVTYNNII